MRMLVIAVAVVGLAGCAAQRQREFDEAKAKCNAEIPARVGRYVERTICINDATVRVGFRSPAQELINATNLDLAEKVDRGEITVTEAKMRSAQVLYDVNQQAAAAQTQQAIAAAGDFERHAEAAALRAADAADGATTAALERDVQPGREFHLLQRELIKHSTVWFLWERLWFCYRSVVQAGN